MARFFSRIQGKAGEATRLGSVSSGISAAAQGYRVGCKIEGRRNPDTGKDEFFIFAFGGTYDPYLSKLIAIVREGDDGVEVDEVYKP